MASFNIELWPHRVHAYLQRTPYQGFWFAAVAGACVSLALISVSSLHTLNNSSTDINALKFALKNTQKSIADLKEELIMQGNTLAVLENASDFAQTAALSAGGYTEDDVTYWRKQMDAYSKMTGTRLTITGRGSSPFKQATKLTVSISSNAMATVSTVSNGDLIKALDFLQLYGYVESFNGAEAVLHIADKKS